MRSGNCGNSLRTRCWKRWRGLCTHRTGNGWEAPAELAQFAKQAPECKRRPIAGGKQRGNNSLSPGVSRFVTHREKQGVSTLYFPPSVGITRSRRRKFCVQRGLRVLLPTSKRQAMCVCINTRIACRICIWTVNCTVCYACILNGKLQKKRQRETQKCSLWRFLHFVNQSKNNGLLILAQP